MGNNLKESYIVYETTNLINNKIYIGVHHTTTPYEFDSYLGCGVLSTQPCTYQYAKTAFQFAVKKYGPKNFRRRTLAVFNTLEEAFELERLLVNEEFVAREDTYNMILGGGIDGLYESMRKKVFQYSLDGEFIAEHQSFYAAGVAVNRDYTAISYAIRFKGKCANCLWSTDKLEHLDTSLYRLNDSGKIKVYVYTLSGDFIKEFKSHKYACSYLNINNSVLKEACEFGIPIKNSYYACYKKSDKFDKARKEYILSRKVYQYDASTSKFITEFETQQEAELMFPKSKVSKSIRLKTDDGNGYKWALVKRDLYTNINKRNEKKPVIKKDLNGNIVKIFESATAAAKEDGSGVWGILRGKGQTLKKHTYEYQVSDIV